MCAGMVAQQPSVRPRARMQTHTAQLHADRIGCGCVCIGLFDDLPFAISHRMATLEVNDQADLSHQLGEDADYGSTWTSSCILHTAEP
jgi:hypothetical protein